jgi:hypothetical protein
VVPTRALEDSDYPECPNSGFRGNYHARQELSQFSRFSGKAGIMEFARNQLWNYGIMLKNSGILRTRNSGIMELSVWNLQIACSHKNNYYYLVMCWCRCRCCRCCCFCCFCCFVVCHKRESKRNTEVCSSDTGPMERIFASLKKTQ